MTEDEEYDDEEDTQVNEEETGKDDNDKGLKLTILGVGFLLLIILAAVLGFIDISWLTFGDLRIVLIAIILIAIACFSININNQYEQSVILRLGKFLRVQDPGLYFIIPIIERRIKMDTRVRTSNFTAKETLTEDNVPVSVDAIIFWKVKDVKKAVLNVEDFEEAVGYSSTTTLRDNIGKNDLTGMLSRKGQLNKTIKTTLDSIVGKWGIDVESVEINEVNIPQDLQNAMSRQAQAQREKTARITLADAEIEASEKMVKAAVNYRKYPEAMKLRWMNQIHEIGLHGSGAMILIPSDMPVAGLGGVLGLKEVADKRKKK